MASFDVLLYVTLALTFISLTSTLYVILRTLLPLIGPHVLSRFSRKSSPLPSFGYVSTEKKQLKSAQRFQCWLAFIDLSSAGIWLWEVVSLVSGEPTSPARMAFAICARPTVLLVVSLLSYLNIIRGKVIELGRFDIVVWVPSVVVLSILVAVTYTVPTTKPAVWQAMLAIQTVLLCVCSWCFGRLLLSVLRVRRATVRSQVLRHKAVLEERQMQLEKSLEQFGEAPMLPPVRTNRWLISKTFLLAKASSAANTVTNVSSMHRRSQSAGRAGRPSTTTMPDNPPRPSASSSAETHNASAPFSFLATDPTTTSRYGHFRAHSNSHAEAQVPPTTPRSIAFSPEPTARAFSPVVPERPGAISRLTDRSVFSMDEPRPSMGSYLSSDSSGTDNGVISYLGGGRLVNGKNGLSRREARKAGARMGGHLVGCVASWTLILPFLIYKMDRPHEQVPLYCAFMVAIGVGLSGPLLAVQTIIAEGLWYSTYQPPLMASSSAVAFEPLQSRSNTPAQPSSSMQGNKSPVDATSVNTLAVVTMSPMPSANTEASSRPSNVSDSSISLASIAAFANPPPGMIAHNSDTKDAPRSRIARALAVAAPHPKLQVMSASAGTVPDVQKDVDIEAARDGDEWKQKEARKLKSFAMTRPPSVHNRHRSDTLASSALSRHDPDSGRSPRRRSALGVVNSNLVNNTHCGEKRKITFSPSNASSPSLKPLKLRNSLQATPRSHHHRTNSAPITPESLRGMETGVLVSRSSKRQTFTVDAFSASLISNLIPGLKVGADSIDRRSSFGPPVATGEAMTARTESQYSSSYKRRRPNLSLSIASRDSTFTKCDVIADQRHAPMPDTATTTVLEYAKEGSSASSRQHLRRRSWKNATTTIAPDEQPSEGRQASENMTTRSRRRPLTPAVEVSVEDIPAFPESAAPRPSLEDEEEEDDDDEAVPVEDSRIEILSETQSPTLPLPPSPNVLKALDTPTSDDKVEGADTPSFILRTKASDGPSIDEEHEVGTVYKAHLAQKMHSRRGSFSSEYLLRPASRNSGVSAHSRSSTVGSITSPGFLNMLSSNRNSWTELNIGNDSGTIEATSFTTEDSGSRLTGPLTARSLIASRSIDNILNEKSFTGTPSTPTSAKLLSPTMVTHHASTSSNGLPHTYDNRDICTLPSVLRSSHGHPQAGLGARTARNGKSSILSIR